MWNAGSRHVTRDDINTGPISETMKARGHAGHNVVVLASECESPTNASPHQNVQTRSRANVGIRPCQCHSGSECFPFLFSRLWITVFGTLCLQDYLYHSGRESFPFLFSSWWVTVFWKLCLQDSPYDSGRESFLLGVFKFVGYSLSLYWQMMGVKLTVNMLSLKFVVRFIDCPSKFIMSYWPPIFYLLLFSTDYSFVLRCRLFLSMADSDATLQRLIIVDQTFGTKTAQTNFWMLDFNGNTPQTNPMFSFPVADTQLTNLVFIAHTPQTDRVSCWFPEAPQFPQASRAFKDSSVHVWLMPVTSKHFVF